MDMRVAAMDRETQATTVCGHVRTGRDQVYWDNNLRRASPIVLKDSTGQVSDQYRRLVSQSAIA